MPNHMKSTYCFCFVFLNFRGQSFKENSSNRHFANKDDGVQDETQGEITESIGGLYEIPEPKQAEGSTKRKVKTFFV